MMAVDLQPVSIVEDPGFQEFVKELDPRYEIPSRRSLMRTDFPELFKSAQAAVESDLSEATDITITTDLWTSRAADAYLSVTCHFIDKEWKMKSFVLSTTHMPGQHTAEKIALKLKTNFEVWHISGKFQAVVTDNGANMVAGIRQAGFKQIPCFAHTINLVVKDSLKADQSLNVALQKCSPIVSFFHHSTRASDKLKEVQQQQSLPQHKLIMSVDTRWNSVYYMLDFFNNTK